MFIVEFVLVIGLMSIVAEIFVFDPWVFNKYRRHAVTVPSLLMLFVIGGLIPYGFNVWSILIITTTAYRLFNMLRIRIGRMHFDYLIRATRSTSLFLIVTQLTITALYVFYTKHLASHIVRLDLINSLVVIQLALSILLVFSCYRNIKKTRPSLSDKKLNDYQLPTLSVCIPARNETKDLEECLSSVVASDYPKLEVIVLDDCSQGKYTSDTIRSFAHNGVRFIAGTQPKKHWLAKNWAYNQLLNEASGEYVLFCGVDVRFSQDSFRRLVQVMLQKKKTMLSVVPDYNNTKFQLRLIQAMRYFWELAPPRRYFNRPPVLSSCWMCKSDTLKKIGGFTAATRAIVPEAFFARTLVSKDMYSFVRSNSQLGVKAYKKFSDQRDTFIRVRYPQLHKKPQLVFLFSTIELVLLIMPFVTVFIGANQIHMSRTFLSLNILTCFFLILSYGIVISSTYTKKYLITAVVFPITLILDVILLHFSMYEYEMSAVAWKSRNVCIPTMHFTPSPNRN